METKKFYDLVKGLKSSSSLDNRKSAVFYEAFAQEILSGNLYPAQMRALYQAIPKACNPRFNTMCHNKARLFAHLADHSLTEESYGFLQEFLSEAIIDAKEKAFFASFFVASSLVFCTDFLFGPLALVNKHKKHMNDFWRYITPATLSNETVANLVRHKLSYDCAEKLCQLAELTDNEGLGCILKAVNGSKDDNTPSPLASLVYSMKGRKLVKRLLSRLCAYVPVDKPCKKGVAPDIAIYDPDKRVSTRLLAVMQLLHGECWWFEQYYVDLDYQLANAFLKGGGDPRYPAIYLLDINWYLEQMIKQMQINVTAYSFDYSKTHEMKGKVQPDLIKRFISVCASKKEQNFTEELRLVAERIEALFYHEAEDVFLHCMNTLRYKKQVGYQSFVDMLTKQNAFSMIRTEGYGLLVTKSTRIWGDIVRSIANKPFLSEKDLEYICRIHINLNNNQRNAIRLKLEISDFTGFKAVHRLYRAANLYKASTAKYPAEILYQLDELDMLHVSNHL